MNIYSKLLLGAAALSFAACSSEEPITGSDDQSQVEIKPSGDAAYLTVRIQPADNSGSRAEGDYLYGDKAEQAVENAYFYFYDEDGHYVLESNIWLGGTSNGNGSQTADHIEFKGNITVMLTGLEGKNYPSWVVTVLNKPEGFQPAATLAEMSQTIIDNYSNGAKDKDGNETNFTMTTSSFFGGVNATDATDFTYFATKLKPSDFKEEGKEYTEADGKTVVDIYVERVAARVGVRVDLGEDNPKLDGVTYNGHDLYELNVSVAGEGNPNLGDESNTAATKVYIAILGWELNSTAKNTYIMKNLNGWKLGDAIGGNTEWWNNAGHHRSFWGKSTGYGKAGQNLIDALKENKYAWDELNKQVSTGRFIGDRVYCNETTNTRYNIVKTLADGTTQEVFAQYTPSVVLSAVVCNEKGEALELVRYQGVEYLKDAFIKMILSRVNKTNTNQNYYIRTQREDAPAGVYDYRQVDVDDVKLVSAGAGLGTVNVAVVDEDIKYYTNLKATTVEDTENNIKYSTHEADEVDFTVVNELLATPTSGASKAVAKTNGAMFYTIPLTHLNKPADNSAIVEGQYGLVRNHVYDLSITKIKSLGDGVFKPHKEGDDYEPINPDEPKNPTYYVESSINILSWKIVSQEVEI